MESYNSRRIKGNYTNVKGKSVNPNKAHGI